MLRFDKTIVLVTRPRNSSATFVADLMQLSENFVPVISPAFENVSADAVIPDFEGAVFTSRAGVKFAPDGKGRRAFCVGDATAKAATNAGYQAISAQGSALDLIELILGQSPSEKLIHLRGEVSFGNVSTVLERAGIRCSEIITYRKATVEMTDHAKAAFLSDQKIVLPLFSAETVSIMTDWAVDFSQTHIVAISSAVAKESTRLLPLSIVSADHSNQAEMVARTAALIA